MRNSLLFIFDEIWPETMYYSTGTLTRFWSNFKKSKLDRNQLKLSKQHKQGVIYWGGGGEGSTPNSTSSPQKFEIKKITQSAMRTYTELDQLSDQTLNDIIDKYKYMLLNTRHAWYVARPFPPKQKFLD